MSKSRNALTVYSNGIGVFSRCYPVKGDKQPAEFTLTVPKDARCDLIASLRVSNNVNIVEPISWPQEDNSRLTLDADNVLLGLITNMTGRPVTVTLDGGREEKGVLMGRHSEDVIVDGSTNITTRWWITLYTERGIVRHPLNDVANIAFDDEDARNEISRALSQAALKFRTNSTHAKVKLSSDKDTEAVIQYALPFPAWQPTYRLSCVGGKWSFDGLAKIDYTGEEDLPDCRVTMVVGEPDTFATDLAEAVTPRRNVVSLVKQHVDGGHVLADSVDLNSFKSGSSSMYSSDGLEAMACAAPASARSLKTKGGFPGSGSVSPSVRLAAAPMGGHAQAEAGEVGDYSVWTTDKSMTLRAKQSSLIPLFSKPLGGVERVLYYNKQVNATRPKSAVQFKNELSQSLGKGVCSLYDENQLIGESVLNSVKTGEKVVMVYATETGVKVLTETSSDQPATLNSISIGYGVITVEELSYLSTKYTFNNVRDEAFTLIVEHTNVMAHGKASSKTEIVERTQNGVRLKTKIPAKSSISVVVEETAPTARTITLDPTAINGLILQYKGSLEKVFSADEGVLKITKIANDLAKKNRQIQDMDLQKQQYDQTSTRYTGLLSKADVGTEEQKKQWRAELGKVTGDIAKLDTERFALVKEVQQLNAEYSETLHSLQLTWTAK